MKYFFLSASLLLFATGCTNNVQSVVVQASPADNVNTEEVSAVNDNASADMNTDTNAGSGAANENSADEVESPESPPVQDNADSDEVNENVNQATNTNEVENTNTADREQEDSNPAQTAQIQISLQVVSPGESQTYSVKVDEGTTVESMMEKLKNQGLTYTTKGYGGIGKYVTTVNGLKENTGTRFYWILYLNGARATAGISTLTLKKNDAIKWNYEKEF